MSTVTATAEYAKGFETLHDETTVDALPLDGTLPAWLHGSLLRTGPAQFEAGDRPLRHWFDGLAMLHRFTFADGAVGYGNRFLEGRSLAAVRSGDGLRYPEFATDPCRSLFKRVQTLFAPEFGDNANINVFKLGERFVSMTETPIAVEFDPRTLAAAGVPFQPPGELTTAHPHADPDGAMVNFAAKLGPRSEYRFFRVAPDGADPEPLGAIKVAEPGYVHSFGLTPNWLVLVEVPWRVNPARLALSGRPYAENYRWKPELGTRVHLVDRATGEAAPPIELDPMFLFHHVNAFEDGEEVVVDVCAYEDASIVDDFYLDRLRADTALHRPDLRRLRLDPRAGTGSARTVVENLELAQIDYARRNGQPYRYAWGVASERSFVDAIVRADVVEGTTQVWREAGMYPGEPVYVARPDGTEEDDGVLLSVVLDSARGSSFLLVLDAHDLSELARATVPHHIPFSFHGRYAAGCGL